jgi:preprotein translocase subunit SecE
MAKSRAQRKAEKRRRQQAQQDRQPGRPDSERRDEERAQENTQMGVSGDVAEVEAIMETGARTEDYGEHVNESQAEAPQAPAPSRADVGQPPEPSTEVSAAPASSREQRREAKRQEKEAKRRERQKELQKAQAEKAEKRRGGVLGFFASCWAELKKVQWPDRDTLVQASAVTLIFVVVMAAYLGGLDAVFNYIVKNVLL